MSTAVAINFNQAFYTDTLTEVMSFCHNGTWERGGWHRCRLYRWRSYGRVRSGPEGTSQEGGGEVEGRESHWMQTYFVIITLLSTLVAAASLPGAQKEMCWSEV